MDYKITLEIDLSDSLKQFIKSLIPNSGIAPISDSEWENDLDSPEIEGQISMQEAEPTITKEQLLTLGGEIAKQEDGSKKIIEILSHYGAKSLPQLNTIHYPKVYEEFTGVLSA